MKRPLAFLTFVLMLPVVAVFVALTTAVPATAKKPPPAAAKAPPPGVTVNACGCYRTEAGTCLCGDKKGKCECPGDCEPVGCEAKRAKEVEKEIAAETKKAQEEERKQKAAEAARAAKENTVVEDEGSGDNGGGDEATKSEAKPETKKGDKGARKSKPAPKSPAKSE